MNEPRCDLVVIMARGQSLRMGQPKGEMCLPDCPERSFLQIIIELYERCGLGGVVVTTGELVALYQSLLPPKTNFEVLGFAGGGETGRTLAHGLTAAGTSVSHLWAHPVDLPLVMDETIRELQQLSVVHSGDVLRPQFGECVGHPVIMPVKQMAQSWSDEVCGELPMRAIIAKEQERGHINDVRLVAVTDPGVVQDYDQPSDFEHNKSGGDSP